MRKYEGMFIIKPDMSEDGLKKVVSSVEEIIKKNEGSVETLEKWARRRLAYPIKDYREGEYYLCGFEAPPGNISAMENAFKLSEDILRALITVKES